MKLRKEYTCPVEYVHDVLKGKWKMVILYQLKYREKASLSDLEKDIKGINQKMLIQHLKELIECGFIGKNSFDGYPLRVEYFLTEDRGKKILEALEIMQDIGKDFIKK